MSETEPDAGRTSPLPRPGDLVELEVTDLSGGGRGVGRAPSGVVVMVRGAVPGDRVRARVTATLSRHVEAILDALLVPSMLRRQPRCRHFGICGGCSLQTLDIGAQREFKGRRVRELLRRMGGLTGVACDETIAVGPEYGTRNRMEFSFAPGGDGVIAGLHREAGPVFDLAECHLPDASFARLLSAVRDLARRHGVSAAEARTGRAGLLRLDLRKSSVTEGMLLTLYMHGPPPPAFAADLAALHGSPWKVAGIVVIRDEARAEADRTRVLAGTGTIQESILGLSLRIGPGTFVQTSVTGVEAIYRAALAWLEPVRGDRFLDLYAGLGVLAMAANRRFPSVTAVEGSAGAVEAGRRAAEENGRAVRFLTGDALAVAQRLAWAGERFDVVVMNPPRAGLHRGLPQALARLGPTRLAYISCDAATLARDLARLRACDLETVGVTPYDLFPQTAEVESLARLERTALSR